MKQKTAITIITITLITVITVITLALSCLTFKLHVMKDDKIIKQNNKEILVRKYKTHVTLNKNLKSFNYTTDSSLWRYPPNKILYDGKLIKAKHDPHEVVLRISKQEVKNGVAYKVTTNKDVSEYFSCSQVDEFENNIGKRMVITKVFFPRERIFYKFP